MFWGNAASGQESDADSEYGYGMSSARDDDHEPWWKVWFTREAQCILALLVIVIVALLFVVSVFVKLMSAIIGFNMDGSSLVTLVLLILVFMCVYSVAQLMWDEESYESGFYGGGGSYSSFGSYWGGRRNTKGTPPELGATGLHNLGNTCYMNSTLQCLSHIPQLTEHFVVDAYKQHLNTSNPMGTKGKLVSEYARMLKEIWGGEFLAVAPTRFKKVVGQYAEQFKGNQQHDSQELLGFVLDRLHEDLNQSEAAAGGDTGRAALAAAEQRVAELEKAHQAAGKDLKSRLALEGAQAWRSHIRRNYSLVSELFQGQLLNCTVCPRQECGHVSSSFDTFMYLPLPLPSELSQFKVTVIGRFDSAAVEAGEEETKFGDAAVSTADPVAEDPVDDDPVMREFQCAEVSLRLSKTGCVQDLKAAVAQSLGLPKTHKLIACQIFSGRPSVLKATQSLQYLANTVFMYVFSDDDSAGYVPIIHRRTRRVTRTSNYAFLVNDQDSDDEPQVSVFANTAGIPLLLPASRYVTVMDIRRTALLWAQRCCPVSFEELGYEPRIGIVNKHGSACGIGHSNCRGCELGYHDDSICDAEAQLLLPGVCIDWGTTTEDPDAEDTPQPPPEWRFRPQASLVDFDAPSDESKNENSTSGELAAVKSEDGIQLSQCLDQFSSEEILGEGNLYTCGGCQQKVAARKSMKLWRLPNVVVIVLKRFYYNGHTRAKVETLVRFPLRGLDLNKWLTGSDTEQDVDDPAVYDLFAVSNHSGSLGSGHYTAYAKSFLTDTWHRYNDSGVSRVGGEAEQTEESVEAALQSKTAYVLMYQRRGSRPSIAIDELLAHCKVEEDTEDNDGGEANGSDREVADTSSVASAGAMAGGSVASSVTLDGTGAADDETGAQDPVETPREVGSGAEDDEGEEGEVEEHGGHDGVGADVDDPLQPGLRQRTAHGPGLDDNDSSGDVGSTAG